MIDPFEICVAAVKEGYLNLPPKDEFNLITDILTYERLDELTRISQDLFNAEEVERQYVFLTYFMLREKTVTHDILEAARDQGSNQNAVQGSSRSEAG